MMTNVYLLPSTFHNNFPLHSFQFFGVIFACYIAREIKIRNGITGFM